MRVVISVYSFMKLESGEDVLCGHVKFHESLDLSSSFLVAVGDILRTREAGFFSGIETELGWGGGFEAGLDQDTEDLDGVDGTGTILERCLNSVIR